MTGFEPLILIPVIVAIDRWYQRRKAKKLPPSPPDEVFSAPVLQPKAVQTSPTRDWQVEQARREAEQQAREDAAIAQLTARIQFTTRQIQIGEEQNGERVIGREFHERQWPSDRIDVRPIRDLSELPDVLPGERARPFEMQLLRAVTGEALVTVHQQEVLLTEPIYKPVFRRAQVAVYLLLDLSGSMKNDPWKIPIWKRLSASIIRRTVEAGAVLYFRWFTDTVGNLVTVATSAQAEQLINWINSQGMAQGGTDIPLALNQMITDFTADETAYDMVDVMILTDGENEFPPQGIRRSLETRRIRLHATLLGEKNTSLRDCADTYYLVTEGPVVHDVVTRSLFVASSP